MTRVNKAQQRKVRKHQLVGLLTAKGVTLESGLRRVGIPRSKFYYQAINLAKNNNRDPSRYSQINQSEKNISFEILKDYSNKGNPLRRSDIVDAASSCLKSSPTRDAQKCIGRAGALAVVLSHSFLRDTSIRSILVVHLISRMCAGEPATRKLSRRDVSPRLYSASDRYLVDCKT